ncbi:MAG: IS1 family transposase [Agitococcus sp.]|nr:IS1 family transposase [Agitococcus sp.]
MGLFKKVGECARQRVTQELARLRIRVPEFKVLVLDDIYTYVQKKAKKCYIFTAYGVTDLGHVVRFGRVYDTVSARSLERFLALLPSAEFYFSDGAPMYGTILGTKVLQEKGVMTNLVESFNAQVRQYLSALRRRTKACAKTKEGMERQLALALIRNNWLRPTKPAYLKRKSKSNR